MKKVIGKYIFEIAVIFIGITASFLFEEWRQQREKDEKSLEIMKSIVIELERNDLFIASADSTYLELNTTIDKFMANDQIDRTQLVEISYMLLEGVAVIRLKDISSYIIGFSSSDQLNIINRNKEILRYQSYSLSLLTEHEIATNSLMEYSSANLWPLIITLGIDNDIINYQKELSFQEESSFDGSKTKPEPIPANKEFLQHLKWTQLKILRLIQINQAIHMQVANIKRELNKAIKEPNIG